MADFHQTGVISTLHRLGEPNLQRLERELLDYSAQRPIALVLPSLYSEIQGPALKRIVDELSRVPYLAQCVVSLSGALRAAGLEFVQDPMGSPQIPNWNRVVSAMPDFLTDLREAIEADAQDMR